MHNLQAAKFDTLKLYLTIEHECSYLPNTKAKTLFIDPEQSINPTIYQYLLSSGFRRSGDDVYRPFCQHCNACTSIRIPVRDFTPRRSQQRCWKRNNSNLSAVIKDPIFYPEHYDLYKRYITSRHVDSNMINMDADAYLKFLTTSCCSTMFIELRDREQLVAVAITDVLPNALSAVYTFFDPDLADRSLGVLAILWQLNEAKLRNLQYLYLGYWINGCQKMRYKDQYRPLEAWNGKFWKRYEHYDVMEI